MDALNAPLAESSDDEGEEETKEAQLPEVGYTTPAPPARSTRSQKPDLVTPLSKNQKRRLKKKNAKKRALASEKQAEFDEFDYT